MLRGISGQLQRRAAAGQKQCLGRMVKLDYTRTGISEIIHPSLKSVQQKACLMWHT